MNLEPLQRAPFEFDGGVTLETPQAEPLELPEIVALPDRLYLELGADDRPIVQLGDHVLAGQTLSIGESHIHAPTSGRLLDVQLRPTVHPRGGESPALVLEPDGLGRRVDPQPLDETQLTADRLIARLREAGVVGMGGGGFPTDRKLAEARARGIETLVINAVECEPGVTADAALLAAHADDVLAGAATIARALAVPRCLIGIDARNRAAVAAIGAALGRRSDAFEWHCYAVPPRYPAGSERALIRSLTGIRLAPGERPTERGTITFNTATLHAVHQAVALGEPCTRRVISITGDQALDPGDRWAHIGHPVADFAARPGCRIIAGGTLAGWSISADTAIGKTTLGLDLGTAAEHRELPCIRCQRCTEVCPEALLPERLLSHARCGDARGLKRERLSDCIECGACDVVCPSSIPLLAAFRDAGATLAAAELAAARADAAHERYRRHELREDARRDAETKARALRRRNRTRRDANR